MRRSAFENIDGNRFSHGGSDRRDSSKIPIPTTASKLPYATPSATHSSTHLPFESTQKKFPPASHLTTSHLTTPCTPRLSFGFAQPSDTLSKPPPGGFPRRLSLMPPASSARSSMCPAPATGRQSLAGGRSGAVGGNGGRSGAGGAKVDPRPITNKAYQNRCAESVLEYLLQAGYDRSLNLKVLAMPSSKEFFKMAEFLFARIDPRFKFGAKPEDDLVATLKWLGYPFTISKNALHSVGTPHTWPPLLAMLHWLVQLLNYTQRQQAKAAARSAAAGGGGAAGAGAVHPMRRLYMEQVKKGFRAFMTAPDDESAAEASQAAMEEFVRRRDDLLCDVQQRVAEQLEVVERLQEEVREGEGPSRLEQVMAQREALMKRVAEAEKRIAQTRQENKALDEALEEKRAELEARKRTTEALKAECARVRAAVAAQGVTAQEVERMRLLRAQREEARQTVEAGRREAEKEAWSAEVEVARLVAALEGKAVEMNGLATRRKLIPSTAKNAKGMDYEVRINPRGATWEEVLGDAHPKAEIRAGLAGMVRVYEAKRAEWDRQLAEAEAHAEQAERDAREVLEECEELEKSRQMEFQEEQEELDLRQRHMETMTVQVKESERRVRQEEASRSREIAQLEQEVKLAVAESRAERCREVEEMGQVLQRVARADSLLQAHMRMISSTVAGVEEGCNRVTLLPMPE